QLRQARQRSLLRLPRDIGEFRHPDDPLDRLVHIIFWVVTLAFMVHLVWYVWTLARPTIAFFYPGL
ncbi:MAG: hypothetical protein M1457_01250, partial [bacterium]|nr:hypothetical protein [bacterium]